MNLWTIRNDLAILCKKLMEELNSLNGVLLQSVFGA